MKKGILVMTMFSLTCGLLADDMAIKQEGVKYIKMLGGTLKSHLVEKMKADPSGVEALNFCTTEAQQLTHEVNEKLPEGVKVRRTGLKYRSDANKPDFVDVEIMKGYLKKIELKNFTPDQIAMAREGNTTRVYKPLVVGDACMKCHGTEVDPVLKAKIAASYPNDTAMGFTKGEFRGVIVSEITK